VIKILDLCSGIGGFSLGLEATGGFETVAFCEFDEFCCKVLNKHWPGVPIYNDLKELGNEPERIIQEFDLICGGIPCQPFSVAGKKKGKEDDRHLWPYMYEIVKHKKPTWVIVENVGGFVNVALDDVCLDLEAQGYATQSFVIPACSVEAPHRRDRVWILGKFMGDTSSDGRTESESSEKERGAVRQSEEGRVLESKGASDVENSGRALRQGGIEQGENGNEVGQGDDDSSIDRVAESKDVPNASGQRLEGHRGEHGLRETSEEEQASRSSQEQDVSHAKELDRDVDVNGHSGQGNGQQTPRTTGTGGT
jgi:DNA (cytosine-5)-methyltransferase 1